MGLDAFWDEHLRVSWGRAPRRIPAGVLDGVIGAGEVLDALREVAPDQLDLTVGVEKADPRPILPDAAERDVATWERRVRGVLGAAPFTLIATHLQTSFGVFTRLARFVEGLYARRGVASWATSDLFIGDYQAHHPYGAHRDRYDVFSFVLAGRKRYHLWPAGFFRTETAHLDRPPASEHPRWLGEAQTIEAGPGEVVYWPRTEWHKVETAGFAVSLTVGVQRGFGDLATLDTTGEEGNDWDALVRSAPRAGKRELRRRRLLCASTHAFHPAPAPLAAPALDDDTFLRALHPIAVTREGPHGVIIAMGRALRVPWHPHLPRLVRALTGGARVRDAAALFDAPVRHRGAEHTASREAVAAILSFLARSRALGVEAQPMMERAC